jgi:hypothetical protein
MDLECKKDADETGSDPPSILRKDPSLRVRIFFCVTWLRLMIASTTGFQGKLVPEKKYGVGNREGHRGIGCKLNII